MTLVISVCLQFMDIQIFRPMRLHLHCQRGIFTRDFEAVIVDSLNHEEAISVDKRHFYEGYVEGNSNSNYQLRNVI